jgi:hypothetical protein
MRKWLLTAAAVTAVLFVADAREAKAQVIVRGVVPGYAAPVPVYPALAPAVVPVYRPGVTVTTPGVGVRVGTVPPARAYHPYGWGGWHHGPWYNGPRRWRW